MPPPIKNCFASAASSFWQWSLRGAGMQVTSSPTGDYWRVEKLKQLRAAFGRYGTA
jgi:hypothetical protein